MLTNKSEELLISNAAETLLGEKASNLVCLKKLGGYFSDNLIHQMQAVGIECLRLENMIGCPLLLVYRKKLLEEILGNSRIYNFLENFGYTSPILDQCLMKLKNRFLSEMCPDEVGIFLGYPLEDVEGFFKDRGKNAIYSGFWKVYGNKEEAIRKERIYLECRRRLKEEYKACAGFSNLALPA